MLLDTCFNGVSAGLAGTGGTCQPWRGCDSLISMRIVVCLFAAGMTLLPVSAQTRRVIVIGVDGLGGEGVESVAPPVLSGLQRRGAWTLQARGVMPTVSSPNWASMIMGAGPEQHGITSNQWQPGKAAIQPVCTESQGRFPTIFGELRRQRSQALIAVFHDWDEFGRLVEPGVPTVMRHVKGSPAATAAAIEYWKQHKPDLLFLHLDDVDHAGHEHGWLGPEYRQAVLEADKLIGRVAQAVEDEGLKESTLILVTADHGGVGKKHGGESMGELQIPWIAAGAGVRNGHRIQAPVNTYDTAATIAFALGIEPHPCWIGKLVREAFR